MKTHSTYLGQLYKKYKQEARHFQKLTHQHRKRQSYQRLLRYERRLQGLGIAASLSLTLLGMTSEASAQSFQVETRVNTETNNTQRNPSVATDADGDFVVVWMSKGQDGSDYGIYGQRYNSNGTPAGSEFRVNTETSDSQSFPSVATDADGDFVVVWQSSYQDGSGNGIYGQRYNSDGTPAGSEFRVNTETSDSQSRPSVATDADGDFVVVWQSRYQDGSDYGIYGQRYNSDGTPAGSEFRVNTETSSFQVTPSVAIDSDGDFVVVWQSYNQDGSGNGIYGQRYNSNGTPAGTEFQVNTETNSFQDFSSVAIDADGDFVVVWESFTQDGSRDGVYGKRYNSNGTPAGSEFRVNTETNRDQNFPSVVIDADGDFVVVWQSRDQDGSRDGVYGQRYNSNGTPEGSEFRVNTETGDNQSRPSVATDADGDFVVVWQSRDQDGSDYGVYGQAYNSNGTPLPVELLSFKGQPVKAGIQLNWQTASETSNQGFYLERSVDSKSWKSLGFVKGNGTTVEQQSYQYLDQQPLPGLNYYRLKQVDSDGTFEYSDIITVAFENKAPTIQLLPNPVAQHLVAQYASSSEGTAQIHILTVEGKSVFNQHASLITGTNTLELSVDHLPAGMYFLQMQVAGAVEQVKFVKL